MFLKIFKYNGFEAMQGVDRIESGDERSLLGTLYNVVETSSGSPAS